MSLDLIPMLLLSLLLMTADGNLATVELVGLGQQTEGIAQLRTGLTDWHGTGAFVIDTQWLGFLAEAHLQAGQCEDALAALRSANERALLSNATVSESQNAYDIARARFDAGAIDYLNLLETQRSLYQAQDNQIATHQGQIAAFVQLRKALGS